MSKVSKKVLVVDDESDARAFVRAIMEPDGWQVTVSGVHVIPPSGR